MNAKAAAILTTASLMLAGCLPGMPIATAGYGGGGYGYGGGYGGGYNRYGGNAPGGYGTTWESMVNGPSASQYGGGGYGYPQQMPGLSKQVIGGATGAALGGFGCSHFGRGGGQLAATAACTLAGFFLGGGIGASLDRIDMMHAQNATAQSLNSGQAISWQGQQASGVVIPTNTGVSASGMTCREYQQNVTIGGRTRQAFGQACRQSDGSWKVVAS